MTPADLVKLARAAKSGKKVTSGLSAAKEAATISNMQQAGELPLSAAEMKRAAKDAQGDYLPGVHYADPLQAPTMRMSEALGNVGAEGKTLRFTEADRSRVFGPNRGGVGFSALQHYSIPHKEARTVWGYGNESKARQKINQGSPESTLWTTYAGSPTQHKSNTVVVKDAIKTLQEANKAGTVHPEQIKLINYRLQQAVNDKGKPLFPEGFDITDPKALSHATTFDRRAIISDALMGLGVKKPMRSVEFKEANPGVVWSDASNIENILTRETEPILQNANTFDVGPNLFTIENQVIHRPDLNEAFPYQVTGEDLGMRFEPTPFRLAAPEFAKDMPIDEAINAWKMSRGNPSQFVSEEYLTKLQKKGRAKGGLIHMAGGGTPEPKRKSILDLTPLTEAAAAVQNAFKAERGTYGDKGAAMDILNRGIVADTLGGAADLANLPLQGLDWLQSKIPGLSKPASVMDVPSTSPRLSDQPNTALKFPLSTDAPFGGSEAWKELFKKSGVTSKTERPVAEISTSLLAPLAPVVASKAAKVAKAVAPRAGDLAYQFMNKQAEAMGLPLEMGVVKTKGGSGNWLAGSVEQVTKPMKSYVPTEESLLRAEAVTPVGAAEARASSIPNAVLNKWIDKKLNFYIKNEMGTPEDQIRLGIERRAAEAETLKETNQVRLDKMAAAIERNKAAGKDTTLTERDLEAAKDKFDEEYQIASQGLYHGTVPEGGWMGGNVWEPQALAYKREKEGFPKGGMGTHPAAKQWEALSDAEIHSTPAGQFIGYRMPKSYYDRTNSLAKDYNQKVLDQNPWLSKVDPETKVYKLDEMNPDVGLEFRHMIDEVKTAMDPASNLPKHLKIAAKDLEKMTVDDVSALSGKISAWRNAQIGKPNLELANNPAVSLYKEYPTANNPKGVSWRQIKRPEGLPDEEADKALRDAIGYEGDIMRHCVGGSGHCEPLLRGDTEVYSLRDAKGEPHVTIEVEPAEHPYEIDMKKHDATTKAQYSAYVRQWRQRNPDVEELTDENVYQALREAGVPPVSPSIVEIKGKNNGKPKDEYIPFIQDFIKSGNWSDVGDLHHTDLHKVGSEYFTEPEFIELAKKYGRMGTQDTTWEVARQRHIDQGIPEEEALLNWVEAFKEGRGRFDMPPKSRPEGMKRGGAVRMAEGGEVPKAPSNWTDYLSQHAQEESMRLMGGDTALNPMKDGGSIDDMIRNAVEKANSRNYASGGASLKNIESEEGLAPYGLRHSGEGAKGKGYFGVMPGKRGMVTELSTEAEGVGEHPLIVPTLTREELEYLLAGGDPTEPIYQKAYKHAQGRKSKGKGAFADPSELRHPEPEYADGGVVNIDDLIRKAVTLRNQHA